MTVESLVDTDKDDSASVITPGKEYGYDRLTKTELRKTIADLTKSVLELKQNKKDYVGAINESLKDLDKRTKSAAEALKYAEATGQEDVQEVKVLEFLKQARS